MAKKEFVEGKGWIITDDKSDVPPALRQNQAAAAAAPIKISRKQVEEFAKANGLVLIAEDDLKASNDRIAELEQEVFELEKKLAGSADDGTSGDGIKDANKGKQPAKGKKAKTETPTDDEKPVASAETIGACETLDELNLLMVDVEDQELLDLADLRADELKGE